MRTMAGWRPPPTWWLRVGIGIVLIVAGVYDNEIDPGGPGLFIAGLGVVWTLFSLMLIGARAMFSPKAGK